MRYIGSKRKLLEAIVGLAEAEGVCEGATVLDIFSGTAAVGRRFKERGCRVVTNDRMRLSYVLQRALVVADEAPPDLAERARALEEARPREGLVWRQYAPGGAAGRRFFREEAAAAIDGALADLVAWREAAEVGEDAFFLLLAGIIEGASKVANISGTYGAFLKTWQANAVNPFRVVALPPVRAGGARCEAHMRDGNALVSEVACDLLYIDPPYNGREYCANYHVLEAIAERPFLEEGEPLAAFEAAIYGKTGLLPYQRSAYCSKPRVLAAFTELVARSRARHVILSYSEEGLLTRDEIVGALASGLGCGVEGVTFHPVDHQRFRSDRDRAGGRRYRQLAGRKRDGVHEWLFHAARPLAARPRPSRGELSAARRPG